MLDLCTGLSHCAAATMPRPKGRGGKPERKGKNRDDAADRGRSNLREAWAGGNYTTTVLMCKTRFPFVWQCGTLASVTRNGARALS